MVLALLSTALVSIVCFLIAVIIGFIPGLLDPGSQLLRFHIEFGMFATFLVTLAQSMTMFYFIGTGKQVKDLVLNTPLAADFIPRTKRFKALVFPPALFAMLLTMATMIVGGGVHTRAWWTPPFLHWGLAAAALYYNVVAFVRDAKYMIAHNMLWRELEKRLGDPAVGK
jgi:hypothetical protein